MDQLTSGKWRAAGMRTDCQSQRPPATSSATLWSSLSTCNSSPIINVGALFRGLISSTSSSRTLTTKIPRDSSKAQGCPSNSQVVVDLTQLWCTTSTIFPVSKVWEAGRKDLLLPSMATHLASMSKIINRQPSATA